MRRATLRACLAAGAAALAAGAAAGDRRPVAYAIVDGAGVPEPIAAPGDPARGAAIAADPARGGCLACHDGAAASRLDGIGARADPARLRLAVIHYGVLDPTVEGHAFYHPLEPGEAPEAEVGATRLTAAEVEDLVAWLAALRE